MLYIPFSITVLHKNHIYCMLARYCIIRVANCIDLSESMWISNNLSQYQIYFCIYVVKDPAPVTCYCTGDPHCLSFDGMWNHFQGACKYTMAQDNCQNGVPNGSPSWELITNNNRLWLGAPVSAVRDVTMKLNDLNMVLIFLCIVSFVISRLIVTCLQVGNNVLTCICSSLC